MVSLKKTHCHYLSINILRCKKKITMHVKELGARFCFVISVIQGHVLSKTFNYVYSCRFLIWNKTVFFRFLSFLNWFILYRWLVVWLN